MDGPVEVLVADTKPRGRCRKSHRIRSGAEYLAREVSQLLELDLRALREKWSTVLGIEPSAQIGRTLLIQAIAYRLQERVLGGIKPSTERILDRVVTDVSLGAAKRIPNLRARAGTVLIREWHGVRHRVTLLDQGVSHEGRHYRSLTEVARAITGARWSGPLFFGLSKRHA